MTMGKTNWRAIVLGFLTGILATLFGGVIFTIIWTMGRMGGGLSLQELRDNPSSQNGAFLLLCFFIGLSCTVLGGYVTGHIAKESEEKHGVVLGIVGVLFGLIFCFSTPFWLNIIGFTATIPLAILGAYLAKLQRLKTAALDKTNADVDIES